MRKAIVLLAVFPAIVSAAEFRTVDKPVPGQYIVVLNAGSARLLGESNNRLAKVSEIAPIVAGANGAKLVRTYDSVLRGFVVRANDEALAHLLLDSRVAYVEEDGLVEISATQSNATWGLDRSDQRDLPLNTKYTYDTTASNVHAYILDTGLYASHTEFTGRVGNGYSAITDGKGTTDCNGHGTHVAGTIAGSKYGVAKAARIHPVRVLDCAGMSTQSSVIAGLDWVRTNHVKPAVANMSLGGPAYSALDTATTNLINAGVTVVIAAGNDAANACAASPARVKTAVTVGAIDNDDARAVYSNYGSCLDMFAPGTNVTSAWYTSTTAVNTISGTSMAAPHVAGAAALYLATHTADTPTQVVSALIASSSPQRVLAAGSGSPNRLLFTRSGTATPPPGDGTLPTITSFLCPNPDFSGAHKFVCDVSYNSTSPAAALWYGWLGVESDPPISNSRFTGNCSNGQVLNISVIVGNRYGSVTRTASFVCPNTPIP